MRILGVIWLLLSIAGAQACDICGSVNGNTSIGIMASNRINWIGGQTTLKMYETYMRGIRHSKEWYERGEINFRWSIHPRVQLLGWIPYQRTQQKTDFGSSYYLGLSDIQSMMNVVILDKKNESDITIHFCSLAWSVKAPTGKSADVTSADRNLYPGTGSWDQSWSMNYSWKCKPHAYLQTEASYSKKGTNQQGLRNGDVAQCSAWWVSSKQKRKGVWLAATGFTWEQFQPANYYGEMNQAFYSVAGHIYSWRGGIHHLGKSGLLSVQCQVPIHQNLNQSQIRQIGIFTLGYQFIIQKKIKRNEEN